MPPRATPVTVLTGFLGSGKTTLINRILREAHGRRFAVIENEYGEINVDSDLLVKDGGETVVQLTNGCVCCTVRGDLANALDDLAKRRERGEIAFDHVLIEPTGLADPGPIVRTFLAETEVLSKYYLDGVVTLFDAINGRRNLAESVEAQAQLGYADRILVTKVDLLRERASSSSSESEDSVLRAVSEANTAAAVTALDVTRAAWDEMFEKLLELRGYQFDRQWEPIQSDADCRQRGGVRFAELKGRLHRLGALDEQLDGGNVDQLAQWRQLSEVGQQQRRHGIKLLAAHM